MSKRTATAAAMFLLVAMHGSAVSAQEAGKPVIPGFGTLQPPAPADNMPDPKLHYRVAFEVTRAADDPGHINPALDRMARFVNLLGASGIRPQPGDVLAVIHGPATNAILSDAAYQARFHRANPNAALIQELQRAGVAIHVCSYALAGQKIARTEMADGVVVDLAAMVTLVNLQLRGWAVVAG